MTLPPTIENAPAAEPRGCRHGSDEGNETTTTDLGSRSRNGHRKHPRTFRDALDGVMGERSVGQIDDTVRKIERCVAWRELAAETIHRLVESLLETGAQEQEVAEQTTHPPVPTWSTTELAAT